MRQPLLILACVLAVMTAPSAIAQSSNNVSAPSVPTVVQPIRPSYPPASTQVSPSPPIAPTAAPSTDVGQQVFAACHGALLRDVDPGGVVMCMGERMSQRCGADQACRDTVRDRVRREFGL